MLKSGYAISDEKHREEVADLLRDARKGRTDTGDFVWPADCLPGVEAIEAVVISGFGVNKTELHSRG
jgi:hypothetical protein